MKASEILTIARAELGVKERPTGSNRVKYNTWYYGREVSGVAYPWCMAFVQWVFNRAGAAARAGQQDDFRGRAAMVFLHRVMMK